MAIQTPVIVLVGQDGPFPTDYSILGVYDPDDKGDMDRLAKDRERAQGRFKTLKTHTLVKRKYPKMKVTLSMKGDTFKTY